MSCSKLLRLSKYYHKRCIFYFLPKTLFTFLLLQSFHLSSLHLFTLYFIESLLYFIKLIFKSKSYQYSTTSWFFSQSSQSSRYPFIIFRKGYFIFVQKVLKSCFSQIFYSQKNITSQMNLSDWTGSDQGSPIGLDSNTATNTNWIGLAICRPGLQIDIFANTEIGKIVANRQIGFNPMAISPMSQIFMDWIGNCLAKKTFWATLDLTYWFCLIWLIQGP